MHIIWVPLISIFFLQNHIGTCGYEPIYCENKCGVKIHRRHLSQHKSGDCSKRLVPCRYCCKEFVADTLSAHNVKCGRVPVVCPNRCDINLLAREELDSHLKEECTISVLPCSFKDAGCRFKVCIFLIDCLVVLNPTWRTIKDRGWMFLRHLIVVLCSDSKDLSLVKDVSLCQKP